VKPELKAPQVQAPQVQAPQVQTPPQVQAPEVKAPQAPVPEVATAPVPTLPPPAPQALAPHIPDVPSAVTDTAGTVTSASEPLPTAADPPIEALTPVAPAVVDAADRLEPAATQTGRHGAFIGSAFGGGSRPPPTAPTTSPSSAGSVEQQSGAAAFSAPVTTPDGSTPAGSAAQEPTSAPNATVITIPSPPEPEVQVLAALKRAAAASDHRPAPGSLETVDLRAPTGPAGPTRSHPARGGDDPEAPQLPSPLSALGAAVSSAAGSGLEIPAALLVALLLAAPRLGRRLRPTPDLWRPPAYVSLLDPPG
jgi:hypothetical protein